MWQAIIPAALEFGSTFLGSKSNSALKSFEYSKRLQQHQYELNRQTRQTAYQDTRYSLEQAGYNPLLAVGQQANGGTFGASLNVTDPETENLQNRLGKISAMVNIASQRSQAQLNSANSALADEQSKATVQDVINKTNNTSAQVALLNSQRASQDLDNDIKRQTGLNTALANLEYLKSSSASNRSNIALNRAESALRGAQIRNINALTTQTNAQNSAIQAESEWYKSHPKAGNYVNWMNKVVAPTVQSIMGTTQGYNNIRNSTGNNKQYVKGGKK